MKHIKLAVAQRYLQRYTGAQIECAYKEGETPEADFFPPTFVGSHPTQLKIGIIFSPKASVFLRRGDDTITQITEGLPSIRGHFNPFTGEFLQEIPY